MQNMRFTGVPDLSDTANHSLKNYLNANLHTPKVARPSVQNKSPLGTFPLGKMTELKRSDFERLFNSMQNSNIVVAYHASWCGFCKRAMPSYEEAARYSKIPLVALEASLIDDFITYYTSRSGKVTHKPNIESYPTFLIYKTGKLPLKYTGDRNVDSFSHMDTFSG